MPQHTVVLLALPDTDTVFQSNPFGLEATRVPVPPTAINCPAPYATEFQFPVSGKLPVYHVTPSNEYADLFVFCPTATNLPLP